MMKGIFFHKKISQKIQMLIGVASIVLMVSVSYFVMALLNIGQEFKGNEVLVSSIDNLIENIVFITFIGLLVLVAMIFSLGANIKESLASTQKTLTSFFALIQGDREELLLSSEMGDDEFGEMVALMKRNAKDLQSHLSEQKEAIALFEKVCSDASEGFLFHRINKSYKDKSLQKLSSSLNLLLENLEQTFSDINGVLINYVQGDYSGLNTDTNKKGSFASMEQAVISLAVSNSEIFSLISKFSHQFSKDAEVLAHSGDELSTSSNEQASSLEETAAAIEELTSNVSANASKAQSMTQVAKEAKEAAHKGNSVAKESFSAMNEIVNATEAINQAVEMIDNIAFQTNILSLNAAVEAATAGDAGKGFAVVAQEVRNLANRSADAAKEIQELAHRAREKSQGGLETSKNMMESFALISEKIVQTDEMVRDVSDASREQMSGINQINDAVSQLDQMTQQNASTAANVDSIVATVRELSDGIYSDISKKEFVGKEEFLRNAT